MTNTQFPNQRTRSPRLHAKNIKIGEEFGYWTVIGEYKRYGKDNQAHFLCRCKCGTEKYVLLRVLKTARTKNTNASCGCYQKEVMATKRKHGEPGTPEHQRSRWLWTTYRMTLEEYETLLFRQNGVCAICGNDNGDKQLYVDHNHSTGEVRALLCQSCNQAIGLLKENPAIMRKAADYIESRNNLTPTLNFAAEVRD